MTTRMLDRLRQALEARLSKLVAGQETQPGPAHLFDEQNVVDLRTQGNKHLAAGSMFDAEQCFRNALQLNPNDTDVLTCLGYTLKELGVYGEARLQLRRAITLLGDVPDAHEATYLLGQIAEAEGEIGFAQIQYLNALRLKPEFARACSDLCRLYGKTDQYNKIFQILEQSIAACPNVFDYRLWHGYHLIKTENYAKALVEFDKLIQLSPEFAEAHNNRGICLNELNRMDQAIESFTLALRFDPNLSQAHSNRGATFMRGNQFEAAIVDFKESSRLSPEVPTPHINLGEAFRETGRLDEAIAQYEIALQIDPTSWDAKWNKSLALLLAGNLGHGFSLYEYRLKQSGRENEYDAAQKRWRGDTPLDGKSILIYSEQGLGDTIQFCRYVSMVAAMGAKVILEVQAPLLGLLQDLSGVSHIVQQGGTLPAFDYQCPLLSLPHVFKTEENSIPVRDRYITVDPSLRSKWNQRLGPKYMPLIGIVWSGNASHKNDHNRSITLSKLIGFLPNGFRYVSLQQDARSSDQMDLKQCTLIEHFGDQLVDFTETAALCDLMDIVICVDTSVAHLAAALGRPTWILLPHNVDWRWMLDRTDSPWYPTVKLYRQNNLSGWGDVLQRVHTDLLLFSDKESRAQEPDQRNTADL